MKKTLLQVLLICISALVTSKLLAQVDVNDSLALVDLYNSTNGPHWEFKSGWLTIKPVYQWYGIRTSADHKNVTKIFLSNNKLSGMLPPSIGNLKQLTDLYLIGNKLTGSLPASIGNLEQLRYIELNYNKISGAIPVEIGNLTQLYYLDLSGNQLTGRIPKQISNLYGLYSLFLTDNKLKGSIPKSLSYLSNLSNLGLSNNRLTGNIPVELARIKGLISLGLSNNQLDGSIPEELANIKGLLSLGLSNNQLSGEIPAALGKIAGLHVLDLSNNLLSGKIPRDLANSGKLEYLNLSHNQLTGNIPSNLSTIRQLRSLNLSYNKLIDTIPAGLGHLETLILDHNYLSGTIPEDLFTVNYGYYSYLNLSHNQLDGRVPESNRYSFKKIFIDSNRFTFWGMEGLAKREPYFDSLVYAQQRTNLYIHKAGTTLYVNAGGILADNTYNWYKNDVLVATITGDSSYTPFAAGNYTVQVTNAIADKLTLFGGPRYAAGSVTLIAPNPAAYKADDISLKAYPNPAHSYTVVSFKAADNGMLQLSDVKSNILQTRVTNTGTATTKIALDQYAPEVYFITLRCKNGVQTLEIEKQ